MLSERRLYSASLEEEKGEEATLSGDVWVIEPRGAGLVSRLRELWRYRRLFRYFGSRALEKLYRRTVLGRAWIVIRPSWDIVVGTLIFGNLIGIKSGNVPYVLFYLAGTTSWQLFDNSLMWVTRSLELNRKMLKMLYFPRLLLPISMLVPALVYFLINLAFIVGVNLYFGLIGAGWFLEWGPRLLLSGAAVVLIVVFGLGLGLWTAVWGSSARDVRFSLNYILGFWFYLTPVIYPLTVLSERWRWLVTVLNPMAALVEAFKYGILGIGQPTVSSLAVAAALIAGTFLSGLWYFNKAEAASVDRL